MVAGGRKRRKQKGRQSMGAVSLAEFARELFTRDEIPEELGWIAWLSPSHLRLFAGELYAATQANAGAEAIAALLDSWKATAELDSSPAVRAQIERNREHRFVSVDEWRAGKSATA